MKKKNRPTLFVCLLILILAVIGGGVHFILKYMPSREQMNLTEYFGTPGEGEAVLVLGSEILEERGLIQGDLAYLPLTVVNQYLNERYYWDSGNRQILYALPGQLTSIPASDTPGSEVYIKDETVYLSLPYIKLYTDLDSVIYQNPARIAIRYQFSGVTEVTARKNTYVRYQGGIKSPVLTKVYSGTPMLLLEELENWMKVATPDGYIGYVQKKTVSTPAEAQYQRDFAIEEYQHITMDQPVNMVWHQITVADANNMFAEDTKDMTGVNVISPTWYALTDNNGNFTDLSSAEYVQQAHAKGLQVWGLIDNFNTNVVSAELLSVTASRQNLIGGLMRSALNVGLDGINIDFEYLTEEAGVHFLEFLRELSIECHKNGLVLSVDNPVPEDFTSHYNRKEQGEVVDYVIIMGYDEHYVGSELAGSVASLPWVEKGVQDTLEETPPERTILGIPFYARLWKIMAESLSSEALGMVSSLNVVTENKAEIYWDLELSQNVGQYEADGATYKIWLEDGQSIAEKVKLIPKYSLAGVAAWKLGLEDSRVWQTITENLN